MLIAVSFPAMFEHDMEEKKNSRVEVKDVEADVMADMLRYADVHRYADMPRFVDMLFVQVCIHAHADRYVDMPRFVDMIIAQVCRHDQV